MRTLPPASQAVLLLTGALVSQSNPPVRPLTARELAAVTATLERFGRLLDDLLQPDATGLVTELGDADFGKRITRLLGRGLQMATALQRWEDRGIDVITLADPEYPQRVRERLGPRTPPLLFWCGSISLADQGGLVVVGSRNADEEVLEFAAAAGRMAARAGRPTVSGAARGVDRAAMNGALEAGGNAVGVMADSLARAATQLDHRSAIREGQLLLLSPFDPDAGFNVGNAMARNKVIYALGDAALVASSDFEKGGTWAGAHEELTTFRNIPVFVREAAPPSKGLTALARLGARRWPAPESTAEFRDLLERPAQVPDNDPVVPSIGTPVQGQLTFPDP